MNIKTTQTRNGYKVNIEDDGCFNLLLMVAAMRKSNSTECQGIAEQLLKSISSSEYRNE